MTERDSDRGATVMVTSRPGDAVSGMQSARNTCTVKPAHESDTVPEHQPWATAVSRMSDCVSSDATAHPWSFANMGYFGTNLSVPLRQDIKKPEKDGATMTREEYNRRQREKWRVWRDAWTDQQVEQAQVREQDYHQRVRKRVIEMRKTGVTEEEISDFQRKCRKEEAEKERTKLSDSPSNVVSDNASEVEPPTVEDVQRPKRYIQMDKARIGWSEERKRQNKEYNNLYTKTVQKPKKKMVAAGVLQAQIDAFKKTAVEQVWKLVREKFPVSAATSNQDCTQSPSVAISDQDSA